MSMNNENSRIDEGNGIIRKHDTIVYRIVNYMTSLIGGLNGNISKNNPCIGILTPMSPLMIGDYTHTKENTMVLPTPEPLIQLIPNINVNNNNFLNVYSNNYDKLNHRFGPKVTPYINLNNGLLTINEKDDVILSNSISYMSSPNDVCVFSSKIGAINHNAFRNRSIKNINCDYGIIKSPMSSIIPRSIHSCNKYNNNFNSPTEIIVTPELAVTLQKLISIITETSEDNNINENSSNNIDNCDDYKRVIRINRFQRINRKATIGGINYALMSYSATIIQKHYREFENNRFTRYVSAYTRKNYTKNQIFDAIYTIQRHWRIYIYRNRLMKEYLIKSVMTARNEASSKIAAHWYGYRTRKHFDSLIKDVKIKWVWGEENLDKISGDNGKKVKYSKYDIQIRGSFTSVPWKNKLSLIWDESESCYSITVPLSKGVHYLQFIVNDEIRACGSMEIVVLPLVGVSNKLSIFGNSYDSTRKFNSL
ncbi:hypothetical protein FG379_000943 [Cryptosporidium bovis]|uniref:uncharacterized protein n=1 Tax=Cryptosporidium bovis TaxID=310047 RepID=UPI003519DC2C|nr:hypothetical protein FG379_000943 [Cryptosporidium bovis]